MTEYYSSYFLKIIERLNDKLTEKVNYSLNDLFYFIKFHNMVVSMTGPSCTVDIKFLIYFIINI